MTSATTRASKLFSRFLLIVAFFCALANLPVAARGYDGEEGSYESGGMFFYDYADEAGPEAPPAPIYQEPRQSPQLIIIAPPLSEEEYAAPIITRPAPAVRKKKKSLPLPQSRQSEIETAPAPAKKQAKAKTPTAPVEACKQTQVSPTKTAPGVFTPTPRTQKPTTITRTVADRTKVIPADSNSEQPIVAKTLFSESNQVIQPAPEIDLESITVKPFTPDVPVAPSSIVLDKAIKTTDRPDKDALQNESQATAQTPEQTMNQADGSKQDQTNKQKQAQQEKLEQKHQQTESVSSMENKELSRKIHTRAQKEVLTEKHEPAQKPAAGYAPPVIEKLDVEEFVAAVAPGKPTIDAAGNVIHFYSDPMPLVAEPPPDPDYDPDFADFELSRVLPVVDAPDGLYKFSFTGDGIQIAASHTYDNKPVQAGQIVALNMTVTNNSGLKRTFSEMVTAPTGVRGVYEVAPFEIGAGQTVTRRVSLHLYSSLVAGEHKIAYSVSGKTAGNIKGTLEFMFAIRALPRLQFEIASAPLLLENSPFKVSGKLINSGNTGLNLSLNLKGRQKGLQISPARISLPSGGHAFIELTGTTPARNHPLDDIVHMQLLAVTDKKSGSIQLLDEPVKLRIGHKS